MPSSTRQNSKEFVILCRRRGWNIPAHFKTNVEISGALKHKETGQGRFVTKSWRRKITEIIFLTSKKPHCCPATEIIRAVMFRESISICSEDANQTNSICQLCRTPSLVALQYPSAYIQLHCPAECSTNCDYPMCCVNTYIPVFFK
jgi:hypothetical protein